MFTLTLPPETVELELPFKPSVAAVFRYPFISTDPEVLSIFIVVISAVPLIVKTAELPFEMLPFVRFPDCLLMITTESIGTWVFELRFRILVRLRVRLDPPRIALFPVI